MIEIADRKCKLYAGNITNILIFSILLLLDFQSKPFDKKDRAVLLSPDSRKEGLSTVWETNR